jgi:hypothetical protein
MNKNRKYLATTTHFGENTPLAPLPRALRGVNGSSGNQLESIPDREEI